MTVKGATVHPIYKSHFHSLMESRRERTPMFYLKNLSICAAAGSQRSMFLSVALVLHIPWSHMKGTGAGAAQGVSGLYTGEEPELRYPASFLLS